MSKREEANDKEAKLHLNGTTIFRSIAIIAVLVFSFLLTPNRGRMFTPLEETYQYKFAQIMQKEKENPTLMQYGSLDAGYYQIAGILPSCKAFCGLASPIPEVSRLQNESIEQGLTDFVVAGRSRDWLLYEEIATENNVSLYKLKEVDPEE